ncbi:MAG: NAD-dependent epimerase/dehydratase family protein [Nocardioidaceae bacterium]
MDARKISWETVDVSQPDEALARSFAGADAVVHLAWLFHPSHRPEVTWRNNVGGAELVLEAVGQANVPALVAASSVAAYRSAPSGQRADESWPTDGASASAYS